MQEELMSRANKLKQAVKRIDKLMEARNNLNAVLELLADDELKNVKVYITPNQADFRGTHAELNLTAEEIRPILENKANEYLTVIEEFLK